MKIEILPYTVGDWDALAAFIASYWSPMHPVLSRELFAWQYRGFLNGVAPEERPPALLLWNRGALIGFLGLIHGEYQVNMPAAAVVRGCALAMWMVHPDYRHVGLGPLLLRDAERRTPVVVCLGANGDAGVIYRQRGYRYLPALDRWVAPLDGDGYAALCVAPADLHTLRDWAAQAREPEPLAPTPLDVDALADHWRRCTRSDGVWVVQGLARTREFYRARYADSVGFEYLTWRIGGDGPAVIGRVEDVFDHPLRVLRLIELLPSSAAGWTGARDARLTALVGRVLAWGAAQGCAAADFQISNGLLSASLSATTLRPQSQPAERDGLTSLAPVFQPLSFTKPPINAYWRTPVETGAQPWCFPKSDGDMDRPHASC
jgi:GNAT superfamily N-acetyltransferase